MKRQTKVRSLERLIAMRVADDAAKEAAQAAASACERGTEEGATTAAAAAWAAHQQAAATLAAWKALGRPQREYAIATADLAMARARDAARAGGHYSGDTTRAVAWGSRTTARTVTGCGARYSSRCRYTKTNASHEVEITPEGVVDLIGCPEIADASAAEGLPLIAYCATTGAATWVAPRGKAITAGKGWIAADGAAIYHSTVSKAHAEQGARRKAAGLAKRAAEVRGKTRADRRARLVVRLCRGAVATVADALAAGYCEPGIRAWQERNGIGDEAPLADLVRTGDPLATRLALDLARKLRREKTAVGG